jgi:hypothetical protein
MYHVRYVTVKVRKRTNEATAVRLISFFKDYVAHLATVVLAAKFGKSVDSKALRQRPFSQGARPMTIQERRQVLEMVVSGELTVEQAGELLERLDAQSAENAESGADTEKRADQRQRAGGFGRFTWEQIATLRDYEIDVAYVQALEETGLTGLSVKHLISLKDYEVDADYVTALREAGFTDVTVKQLIALKEYDVEADDIRALYKVGLTDLTVERLIALKEYDVDADYIVALREIGVTGLTAPQLIALKELG